MERFRMAEPLLGERGMILDPNGAWVRYSDVFGAGSVIQHEFPRTLPKCYDCPEREVFICRGDIGQCSRGIRVIDSAAESGVAGPVDKDKA